MAETVEFVVNGQAYSISRNAVIDAMATVDPEPIRNHSVEIDGRQFPVKQVLECATGLDRLDFTSAVARRQLTRLGFEVARS